MAPSSWLKSQDIERLKLCKVNLILHLPDHLGNAKIPTTKAHKEKIVKALETLHTSTLYVMDENFISNERAGLSKGATKRNTQGWFYCEKLFAPQFVMLPNCDLVLCCMDYALRHPVGNLLTQSWSEVIRSPEYERIKKDSYRLKGNTICRQCVWSSFEYRLTYSVKRLAQTYYAKKLIKKYANKKAKSKILS